MALRSFNTTLKNSLINNDEFNYAHLVKFEKPTINEDRGETSKKANTYTYITDGAFDIVFDDGSLDEQGNANGAQTYLANKLQSVGSVTETIEAKASSMSITLDTASLGASSTSLGVNFTSESITVSSTIDLVSEGFKEGDKIKFTVLNGSGNNNAKTVIIKNFTAANVFTYTAVDTITANNDSAVTYKIDLVSEELTGVISDKLATTYQTYLNREVFVYKAHFDPITNAIIGEPYLLFKGIISGGSISEDPTKTSKITWTLTSHWGDFSRVSGRLTVDEQHRALDSAGIPDPDALVREDYAGDFGFMHANQAINVMALYNATETSYKQVDINGFWFGGKRLREVESTVQRRVDLGFNLTPKYLPVVYGIRKVDSIPVFVDTDNTDPSKVYVAYAICEGQVAGLLDLYVDGTGSVCVDKADFDLRSGNTDADLTCKGRMDKGDALQGRDITESTGTTDPNLGEDISDLTTNGDDGSNSNDFGVVESNTPTPSFGSSTDVGDPGVLHEQYHKLTSPITATYIFHAGKPDQDADPLLVSKAASTSFKIQNDYFTGTKEYWGPSHRLLDTAYVVAEYTIADGETSIPELDFIVRGKGIKCFNYDSSYARDTFRSTLSQANNFDLGDVVTLKKTSDNSTIASSIKVIDKWTFIDLDGDTEARFRLSHTAEITVPFYMENSSSQKFFFSISSGENDVTNTITSGRQPAPSLSGATIAQNQVSSNNAGLSITLATSEADAVVDAALTNFSKTITFSGRADLLKRSIRGWSYDGTNVLSNIGAGTMSTLDSGATGIVIRDVIRLEAAESTDDDFYNGYGIILKRFDSNGVPHIQQRRIIDYIGAQRLALVDFPWESGFAPTTGDTYILSKGREDIRVSINPALQLLDYLTSDRYGRGLDIDNDINLDTFKEAARQCDTQSDVTVVFPDSTGVAVGDVYKYAVDNAFFEGTVSSITSRTISSTPYDEVTFTNVIGKLGRKFVTWKSRELGELVWNNGNVYKATGTQTLNQSAPTHTSGTANNLAHQSTVPLTKVSGSGASTVDINISFASANGNPLVKSFVGTDDFSGSGYSLYDADDVKYWKYIGWDSNDQRNVTRHQMNQLIATSNPIFDNINLMLNQFNGILRYSNGKYELAIRTKSSGTFVDPEIINESDIIGSISLKDGGLKKSYNSVNTSIVDPQTKFEARSVSFFNSDYLKEDRNIPKQGQYGLPGVTNYYNARYNINQRLDESRFGLTISFKMMPKGALLLPGNLIRVNYPRFGYENKEFRITNVTTNTDCLINVTADEHNDSAFTVKNLAKPRFGREIEIGSLQNKATVNPPTIGSGSVTDSSITIDWSNGTGFNAATDKTQIWARTGSGAVPDNFLTDLTGISLIATVENGATTFVEAVDPDSSISRQYWLRHVREIRRDWSSSSIPVKVFSSFHASASSGGYQQTSPAVFFPRDINGQIFYVRSSTSTTAPALPSTKFYNFSIQAMVETSGGTDKLGALDPDGFDVWLNELPANTTGKQIWAARFHGQETTNVGDGTISVTVEAAFLLNNGTSIDTSLTSLTNDKLNLSGGTLTGDLTVPNLIATTLKATTGTNTNQIKLSSGSSQNIINSMANDSGGERNLRFDLGLSTGILTLGSQVEVTRTIHLDGADTTSTSTPNIESTAHTSSSGITQHHIIFKNSSNSTHGSITTNGFNTTYSTSSDYRLKENVQAISGATSQVLSLNPVNFQWKNSSLTQNGFLAHEVSTIVPEAVVGEKDGADMQSIDQSKLIPILVKTIQELEARITVLEG